jgi:hypothetical protein
MAARCLAQRRDLRLGAQPTVFTDAAGAYTLDACRGCCFTIRVSPPNLQGTPGAYREIQGQITTDGEVLHRDFVMPPRATLRVRCSTPMATRSWARTCC